MNIHQDFLSEEELQFITGRKQKARIVEQLNVMGIPFVTNGNGFPIVRRDYTTNKIKYIKEEKSTDNGFITPNVLKSA